MKIETDMLTIFKKPSFLAFFHPISGCVFLLVFLKNEIKNENYKHPYSMVQQP